MRGSVSAVCENPGSDYGGPGSKGVYLPGVKIPELSMGAREARKCAGSEEVCLPGVKIPEMSMGTREAR